MIEDIQSMINKAIADIQQAEEDCLKAVLRQLLGREPTLDDAKKCTIVSHTPTFDKPHVKHLYYDDVLLGIITISTGHNCKYAVEFTPVLDNVPLRDKGKTQLQAARNTKLKSLKDYTEYKPKPQT